jgi:hypothetical protein
MPENNFIHLFSSSENQIKIERLKLEPSSFGGHNIPVLISLLIWV